MENNIASSRGVTTTVELTQRLHASDSMDLQKLISFYHDCDLALNRIRNDGITIGYYTWLGLQLTIKMLIKQRKEEALCQLNNLRTHIDASKDNLKKLEIQYSDISSVIQMINEEKGVN